MKKILKAFLILSLLGIVSVLVTIAILIFSYRGWRTEFESNIDSQNLSLNYTEIPQELQNRFFEFVASSEKSTFVEISPSEFANLLYFVTSQQQIEGVEVEKIYVEPAEGVWTVYIDLNLGNMDIPWFGFNLVKDDRETAELYVRNIYIGGFAIEKIIPSKYLNMVNDGISDALIQFNENLFSKRYIQNIELSEESAIIKGILY
jgi:hypothetical protein